MTLAGLGFFLIVLIPQRLLWTPTWGVNPGDLERYLNAFTLLLMVFCFYVLYTQRQLRLLRRRLWEGEVERKILHRNLKLTHSLFLSSASLRSDEELEPVLAEVARATRNALGAHRVAMYVQLSDKAERVAVAGTADVAPSDEPEAVREALESRRPICLKHASECGIVIPFEHPGGRQGALVAWCNEPVGELGLRLASVFANNAAAAVDIAWLRAAQRHQIRVLTSVNAVSRAIASSLDLQDTLERILEETLTVLAAEAGSVLLRNEEGKLTFAVVRGPAAAKLAGLTLEADQGVVGHVFRTQKPMRVEHACADKHFDPSIDAKTAFVTRSLLAAPLCLSGEAIGVLELVNKRDGQMFTDIDLMVLEAIANQVALSIDHARLIDRILRAKREWEITLDTIEDCIMVHDAGGHILRLNAAAAQLFQGTPQQLVGQSIDALQRRSGWRAKNCVFCQTCAPGGPLRELVRNDGQRTYLVASSKLGERSYAGAVVHVLTDITDRRRLQHQLVARERLAAVGMLVSGVAHELNNPLTSILGYAGLAADASGDPELRETLTVVQKEARRAASIVRNLLAFAREQKTDFQPVDVHQVIRDGLQLKNSAFNRAGIEVCLSLNAPRPFVNGDAQQLEQVFINLLQNAEDALRSVPEPRRIEICSRAEADRLHITVTDNGPGIQESALPYLFEPFFTTKPPGEGTGLGLSVSYGIIRKHGGEISAGGNEPRGAKFEVSLPSLSSLRAPAEPAQLQQQAPGQALSNSTTLRILTVDDEPAQRGWIQNILTRAGHRVRVAADGQEALEALERETFELVLCDYVMSGVSGRAVYENVVGMADAPTFVFMTGDGTCPETRAFLEDAGVLCLYKPFDAQQLFQLLARVPQLTQRKDIP